MKLSFILFFATFFALYGLVNAYLFLRGWQSIPRGPSSRLLYAAIFLILSLSFIGGRLLENLWLSAVSDVLVWTGSFWIAAMVYGFMALVVIDLLRLGNRWFPFFPSSLTKRPEQTRRIAAITVVALTALVLLAGHLNALNPRLRTLDLAIPKAVDGMSTLRIALASDIHLGTVIGRQRLKKMVRQINALQPDLILLAGDIVDEDLAPVIKQNLGEQLRTLRATFGVFAVTGNHEYIGGVEEACGYLIDHGVTVLRDEVARVNGRVYLVGREDRSITRFNGKTRKPLKDLMSRVDRAAPVILMDHQPFHLEEGENNGADLQVSGHTHQGQLWPVNFIIARVYELGWGYRKKGNTHVYVSNGLGTWGPPVRVGNRPEIVLITLSFQP